MKEYYRVQADIDLDAIQSNIRNTRDILHKDTKIMAIIKADGYGHGAIAVGKSIDSYVDAFGIATVQEGIELRRAGFIKPILILGFNPALYINEAIEHDLIQTVFDYDTAMAIAEEARRIKKKAKIHIKLDTGMTRIGFTNSQVSIEVIKKIAQLEDIEIDGIFTHFASADKKDKNSANRQLKHYLEFVAKLEKENITIPVKHASNSAGIIDMPEANLNMVRSGISTYGLYPSEEVNKSQLLLKPALQLKSHIVFVKEVEAGIGVGYGSTYITSKRTKIATIPVGYGDGYPRQLSSKGRVLVRGKSAPILGRICMDQFMIDVTEIEGVVTGDLVTLIGTDDDQAISVEEMSALAGSFNYEFVCNLGKRIPRVYYLNGKQIGTLDYFNCSEGTLNIDL